MKIKFDNRREFHRINYYKQVSLIIVGNKYDNCQSKNLSLTGMFVTGDFPQQLAGNCLLSISQETKKEKTHLWTSGKVVWCNEEGIGLKFTSMILPNYMSLVSTLINNAKQPSIILKEFPKICPFEIKACDYQN